MKRAIKMSLLGLLAMGMLVSCEKPNENNEEGGGTVAEQLSSVQGKVTDKGTGNPLAGVTIEIQPTGKQVQTAEDGAYILDSLKAGTYTLRAQKDGYVDYTREEIQLIAGQILRLDIEMESSVYMETVFGVNLEMVYVEGGEFEMGATAEQGDDAYDDEYPVRTIKLDGFHIGKYEVTQAQWKAVMGTTLAEQRDKADPEWPLYGEGEDYPMYYVNWFEAQAFCQKLSEATGRKYVLPTEAQWEYAARGGNKSQHYKYAGSNDIEEVAWCYKNSYSLGEEHPDYGTHPVGTKRANELGIYDMSGNVWEWCSDWYGKNYDKNDTVNPQGPVNGSNRVVRGGSWNYDAGICRVSYRRNDSPGLRISYLGFRVAVLL